jgi:membrane protein implicated in regulation of membrane protease activity
MLPDLTQYLWILWLALAVLFVIIELLTLEFTFLLFTIRPLLLRALHRSSPVVLTNVDALVGMPARVTRAFVQGAGEVKLDNGETWTARLSAGVTDAEASVGQSVSVIAVRGAAVEVAPEPRPSTERTVEHD